MRLLIADSDCDLLEMLTGWLRSRGYEVQHALNGERARKEWVAYQPDLVIVDAQLKGVDALAMCRDLRCKHDALVLAMTSGGSVQAEVRCLESGADDVLTKPFFPSQLLAHIHALSQRLRTTLEQHPAALVEVGPIKVDAMRNEVQVRSHRTSLTPTETRILHMLAINSGNVCTLQQIVARVWGYGGEEDTTLIKAHIRHLREKIEDNPSAPRYILTIPGSGYTLVSRTEPEHLSSRPDYQLAAAVG